MLDRRLLLVPIVFVVQAMGVHWIAGAERLPAPPDLAHFPVAIGEWQLLHETPADQETATQLGADRLLNRTYFETTTGTLAHFFVAWFQSQRGGRSQPHSPKVCLPGAGWTPVSSGEATLETAEGEARINRYVVSNGNVRAIVLYWYLTPRRVIADEWRAKFWLVADAIKDKRTDTALVRVVVRSASAPDEDATATAMRFARDSYPLLRGRLPR